MERNFSQHVKEILGYSREEAERLQNSNIVPEHLLLGIIRDGANRAVDALVGLGASLRTIKSSLENELSASNNHMEQQSSELTISKSTDRVLKMSMLEARFMKSQETDSEHLLLAILKESDSPAAKILHTNDITYDEVLKRGLKVMDLTATCMCKENNLPIIVFDMDTVGNLKKVMQGEEIGTLVHN